MILVEIYIVPTQIFYRCIRKSTNSAFSSRVNTLDFDRTQRDTVISLADIILEKNTYTAMTRRVLIRDAIFSKENYT